VRLSVLNYKEKPLSYKILFYILLISTVITILITVVEILFDYNLELTKAESLLLQVEKSYIPPLAGSVWVEDRELIDTQLKGIFNLPDIGYIKLTREGSPDLSLGQPLKELRISKEFPLVYTQHGKKFNIGSLYLELNLKDIYLHLYNKILLILTSQWIKTIIVSIFILFIFFHLLGRHLIKTSGYLKELRLDNLDHTLSLDRDDNEQNKDELYDLVEGINTMRQNLINDITARKKAENDLKKLNEELEQRIKERTEKINQKNVELETAFTNIKEAQTQLIQAEKMAGLGTLVAGIAHEINNPTNIVYGVTHNLENNLAEFKKFIYELADENADEEINKLFEERFLKLQANINDLKEGTQRINTIVQDLRTFSRLDNQVAVNEDITKGINSTIRLLHSQYKDIEFKCDFGAKPVILCWPSKLNQVFMNIMINACHAIQKRISESNGQPGRIYVKTFLEGDKLVVSFEDNGCGMNPDVRRKIFEPFFTTKEVGQGTGMGMSISYGIIEEHQGKIEVESHPGQGSVVSIYLPLDLKVKENLLVE
jgi:signal transduction histidine kinase